MKINGIKVKQIGIPDRITNSGSVKDIFHKTVTFTVRLYFQTVR